MIPFETPQSAPLGAQSLLPKIAPETSEGFAQAWQEHGNNTVIEVIVAPAPAPETDPTTLVPQATDMSGSSSKISGETNSILSETPHEKGRILIQPSRPEPTPEQIELNSNSSVARAQYHSSGAEMSQVSPYPQDGRPPMMHQLEQSADMRFFSGDTANPAQTVNPAPTHSMQQSANPTATELPLAEVKKSPDAVPIQPDNRLSATPAEASRHSSQLHAVQLATSIDAHPKPASALVVNTVAQVDPKQVETAAKIAEPAAKRLVAHPPSGPTDGEWVRPPISQNRVTAADATMTKPEAPLPISDAVRPHVLPGISDQTVHPTRDRQPSTPYVTQGLTAPPDTPQLAPDLRQTSLFTLDPLVKDGSTDDPELMLHSTLNAASVGRGAVAHSMQSHMPQIAQQVATATIQAKAGVTEIALNPEELGRVRMALTTTEGGVSVSITTERPETAELMRRNIEMLAREFRDLGYESVSFTFDDPSEKSGDQPQESAQHIATVDEPSPDAPSPASLTTVALRSGLDLKL